MHVLPLAIAVTKIAGAMFEAKSPVPTHVVDRPTTVVAPTEPARSVQNALFIELLGNGGLYSLNYELRLPIDLTARIGASYIGASASGERTRAGAGLFSAPLTIGGLVGFREHKLELAAGGTIFRFSGEAQVLFAKIAVERVIPVGTATIGYRYAPARGGLLFRAGFTPLVAFQDGVTLYPWGGLSLGGTF